MRDEPDPIQDVNELADELHATLRGLAKAALRRLPNAFDPTELVHQAWLQLSERYGDMPRVDFLALCATIMRRLAVNEVRRLAVRQAGERVTLSGIAQEGTGETVDLLALDEALDRLRATDERWVRIVELKFFGGLTAEEVAGLMGISLRTVTREWTLARAWLKRALA
ncbi:MAG: sigma-70 family RNA polymerase sigma factor [Planctomycetota bacterium]